MLQTRTCLQHHIPEHFADRSQLIPLPHNLRSNRTSHSLNQDFKLVDNTTLSQDIPPKFENQVLAKPFIKQAGPVVFLEMFNTSYDPTPYLAIDHLSDSVSSTDPARDIFRIQVKYTDLTCEIKVFSRSETGWRPIENYSYKNDDIIDYKHYLKFTSILENISPAVLAVTTDSKVHAQARKFLRQSKNKLSETLVVLGGIHANNALEAVVNYESQEMTPMFDMIHTSKVGQSDFKALIQALNSANHHEKLAKLDNYTVLAQDTNNLGLEAPWYVTNSESSANISEVSLGTPEKQMPAYWFGVETPIFRIKTAWGCQFTCSFCATSGNYTSGNLNEVKSFFEKLSQWCEKKQKSQNSVMIYLEDANFAGLHSRKVLEIASQYDFRIGIQARFDTFKSSSNPIKLGLMDQMKDAGVSYIFFGLESVNEEMRDSYDKNNSLGTKDMYEILTQLHKRGIQYLTSCIVGTVGESDHDIARTIAFARLTGAKVISAELPKIYPNTGLAKVMGVDACKLYTEGTDLYTSKNASGLIVGWNVGLENQGCILSPHLDQARAEFVMKLVDKCTTMKLTELLRLARFDNLVPIADLRYSTPQEDDIGFYHGN